jgi:hypothetical protein
MITWNPRVGTTDDDRFNWPGSKKIDGSIMSDPFNVIEKGDSSILSVPPTVAQINAIHGLNQIVAEVNRRYAAHNAAFGTSVTPLAYFSEATLTNVNISAVRSRINSLRSAEGLVAYDDWPTMSGRVIAGAWFAHMRKALSILNLQPKYDQMSNTNYKETKTQTKYPQGLPSGYITQKNWTKIDTYHWVPNAATTYWNVGNYLLDCVTGGSSDSRMTGRKHVKVGPYTRDYRIVVEGVVNTQYNPDYCDVEIWRTPGYTAGAEDFWFDLDPNSSLLDTITNFPIYPSYEYVYKLDLGILSAGDSYGLASKHVNFSNAYDDYVDDADYLSRSPGVSYGGPQLWWRDWTGWPTGSWPMIGVYLV